VADPSSNEKANRDSATRAFSLDGESKDAAHEFSLHREVKEEDLLENLERDPTILLPVLGEYLIEGKIGAGGMGQVFRARHRTMDRLVALKILPRALSNDAFSIERFYAEARATAKLMHPNIVTAFDAGCIRSLSKPVHFLVMELIEGEVVSDRLSRSGPFSVQEVVEILRQSASALSYAHSQGVVHRDIKPSNMMVTSAGVLKILDFGLAVLRDHLEHRTGKESQIVGTVEFMSPEQINAPESVDHRSDLYSLGATIFYLLTGRPMFQGEAVQTALAQINRKPQALYEVRSDIDIRLDSVFQALVAKDRTERCQSANELTEKLITLNLIERPVVAPRMRTVENAPSKFGFDFATSTGLEKSTSQRSFAAVGIELGMIHSRVSYIDKDHRVEEILVDGDSTELRNMLFSEGERVAIGSKASALRATKPNHIFYGMQRWYGVPLLERPFGGRQVPPEVLMACVIRQLVSAANQKVPNTSHAVITVPACYNQMLRLSTKTAAAIAGVEVLQLLDKPIAAALAHTEIESRLTLGSGMNLGYSKTFLVAMLNGTACEVSLVRAQDLSVQSIASVGDWKRGITRWHDRAAKLLASEVEAKFGSVVRDDLATASRLQRTMERAFDRLRLTAVVPFVFEVPGGKFERQLDREKLADWVGELEQDCVLFAKEALNRSRIDPSQIDGILLLGDLRWMPKIQRALVGLVGPHAKLIMMRSSDLSRGAALQARCVMPPVAPNSTNAHGSTTYDFGVIIEEQVDRLVAPKVLIGKDSVTPASSSRTLRFTHKGNRQPILQFVEGARQGSTTWNRLGRIELQTCFEGRNESDPLQLRLEVDESGIWSSSLTWLAGNKQIQIPQLAQPQMDIVSTKRWRDWLESLMLCNTEHEG
jgi:eukaryotic-like serine/threonine-protein kinase